MSQSPRRLLCGPAQNSEVVDGKIEVSKSRPLEESNLGRDISKEVSLSDAVQRGLDLRPGRDCNVELDRENGAALFCSFALNPTKSTE
ncbi:hypothetical protein KFK09_006590 [Dendrobium nobile]|uniref:Uncharacterized protein n=1 Tax=Dendrobium nobile TaxID=94219 RepID=A0A8T3BS19_DENNO|nr:hypothetical protein KFK09_006590 [Dendrobium nobile]